MTRVFISYRRNDTADAAHRLFQGLTELLPHAEIFIDVASLDPAEDWMRQVVQSVHAADWCLVLIGRNWLERGPRGSLRLDDRSDIVRLEVATAITHGVPVLPVTVDDAKMPPKEILPLSVARLSRFQRHTLSTAEFAADVRRIVAIVENRRTEARRSPMPPELVGFWSHATPESGSSYEFFRDGTYLYAGVLRQNRPGGSYSFEIFDEGIVDAEPDGVMRLQPLRVSATQEDNGRPETSYSRSPRELIDKTMSWRLLPKIPPQIALRAAGQSETVFDLQWRDSD
jgi:TIR domain